VFPEVMVPFRLMDDHAPLVSLLKDGTVVTNQKKGGGSKDYGWCCGSAEKQCDCLADGINY